MPLEVKKVEVFVKLEMSTSGSSPSPKTCVSVERCCSACYYYRNPYSCQQTWKNMKNLRFFEELSSHTSLASLWVTRERCLVHFWWKIFSPKFQLIFWIMFFAQFRWKFHVFWSKLDSYAWLQRGSTDQTYENHWIFRWNHVKNMVQNESWKIDENIFHEKCAKQHSMVTESVPSNVSDSISSQNHKNTVLRNYFHVRRIPSQKHMIPWKVWFSQKMNCR